MNTTFERLRAILVKDYKLDVGQVTLDAPLEALGVDSLGMADMLFNVEDAFHILLPSEPVELTTIGDVVNYIDGVIAAGAGQTPAAVAAVGSVTAAPMQAS
jgi:acyl carrier protein